MGCATKGGWPSSDGAGSGHHRATTSRSAAGAGYLAAGRRRTDLMNLAHPSSSGGVIRQHNSTFRSGENGCRATTIPSWSRRGVHTIQMLSVDGVEKANSGHPGTPMALAAITFEIWTRHLRYDPTDAALARPRPLHPLVRARVDAALLDAAPRGLRPAARRAQALSPVGIEDAGASRVVHDAGRRAHDRAARAGDLERGRASRRASRCSARASTAASRPSRRRASSASPRTAT